jgi:glycosyltransferase involved in cell wall biosynthesis
MGGAGVGRRRALVFARAASARRVFADAHVVHYPLTIPLPPTAKPQVVTLHDLLHRDLPAFVSRRVRLFRRLAYDRAAVRADRVIVPSAWVRDRAVHVLGLEPDRVRVVNHAVDTSIFFADDRARDPFVLYPARGWPHKNHALLFEAFSHVRRERPDLRLVLTGGGHETLRLPDGARSLGSVDVKDLASLYRRASAVAFPSLYEGFGLPVLEAMASRCPVVALAGTAVEEVAREGAVTFTAPKPTEFAAAISAALESDPVRLDRGERTARSFSWERVAEQHEAVYRELL